MTKSPATGDRLAKVIARSGLCSRRDAEAWIVAGRVAVNGKKVQTPAFNVTDRDKVIVDGAPLAARQGTRVWLYHKPAGLVVTEKDPEGRPTIFEALAPHGLPRVVTVGRLDINTEGLLLLTNDGGLKRVLELPATGWLRRYRVRAHGSVTQAALDGLANGIEIDGIRYGAIEAKLEREQGANVWLTMALREGKNREVKNVLGALGLEVNRLIRVSYGPFQLTNMPIGAVETVRASMLREQLGKKLADAADVDFDSEMPGKDELMGTPTRDRLTGRGTNTVEIAKQRFRFTDSAEKTEREIREEKPRQDRPGRFGATRSAPPKRFEERDLDDMGPPRRIIFADGREEDFVAKTYGKKPGRGGADAKFGGKPGGKPFAKGAPRGDGPRKPFGDKTYDDKLRGPRRDDQGSDRPKRDFDNRPPRGPDGHRPAQRRPEGERQQIGADGQPIPIADRRPTGGRPDRGFAPRTRPDNERSQSPQAVKGRPGRNFSDKPRNFRPDGERPSRPANKRPFGDDRGRPGRDELGPVGKTYGKPRTRSDGKPLPKRDGAAPARGPRPGGSRPPAGRPAGNGRPPAGGGGRPSAGPRRPRS